MTAVAMSPEDAMAARVRLADEIAAPAVRSVRFSGLVALALLVVIVGLAVFVPIASGTVAMGQLAVDGERKMVQHASGGIVSAILVKEGDQVVEGQVILRLDPVQAGAAAGAATSEVDSLRAEEAVRLAESAGRASIAYPQDILARAREPAVSSLLSAETAAFNARTSLARSQERQLDTQLAQTAASVTAAQSDRRSQAAQAALLSEEIAGLRPLLERGLALRSRVLGLERSLEEANGRIASLDAELVRLNARAEEMRSLRARVEIDRRSEAADALRTVRADLAAALGRRTSTQDTLQRTEVRAPTSGVVMAMRVATVGGVVEAGQPLMEIVPQVGGLVVRARVKPDQADNVRQGLAATVRFDAGGRRSAERVEGRVQSISADALTDPRTGEPYFEVRIAVPEAEAAKVPSEVVAPGLPAEVLIETGSHTMLDYLFSPIEHAMFRSMRDS
jgi:HlyD family secretion protein